MHRMSYCIILLRLVHCTVHTHHMYCLLAVPQAAGVRLTMPGPDQGSAGGVVLEGPLAALVRRAAYLYRCVLCLGCWSFNSL